jgi:predicted ATPase
MFIERLAVKGFRSLAEVVWEPGKLNVLIGPNGGGKTNLLKVIRLLKASAAGQLGEFVRREGGMQPIVWDGSAKAVEIEFKDKIIEPGFDYSLVLEQLGASYSIKHEQLVWHESDTTDANLLKRHRKNASVLDDDDGERRKISNSELRPNETVLSLIGGPVGPSAMAHAFAQDLSNVSLYGPVDLEDSREPTVVSVEERVNDDGGNLIPALHNAYSTRRFKHDMNAAMSAAFGSDFEELIFPPAADQRIQMRIRWKSLEREQSAADLSDGTLRFMFLVTVLANPKRAGFIAIEEPEVGFHPSMLPIIADFAAEAAEHSQIVFTTHSPAFLDAIGKHNPTITVVEVREGKTRLRNVSDNELGYWLKQFTLGEIYQSGELERTT